MIRRNFRDGLDMLVHQNASSIKFRDGIRVAFILFSVAVIWMALAIFALWGATAAFPPDAHGPLVSALTVIFNLWPFPSILLTVLAIALCFKVALGQFKESDSEEADNA